MVLWFAVLLAGCDGVFGFEHVLPPPTDAAPADATSADAPPDAPPDASVVYFQAVISDSPIGYFRLGESTGVDARNVIAAGPGGTYIGAVTHGAAGAMPADADTATLFGANGAVDVGDHYDFPGTAPFTLEAWVNPGAFDGSFHSLITKWQQPPTNFGYELYYQDDKVSFSREPVTVATEVCASHGLVAGVYTHVAVTFDGTTVRMYFNGVQVATTTSATVLGDNAQPFQIAAGNNRAFLNGTLDEVAVYDYTLSAARINAHYVAAGD